MLDMNFETARRVEVRPGAAAAVGGLARDLGSRRVALVTDRGLAAAGLPGRIRPGLESAGLSAVVYDDVEADPPEARVAAMAERARRDGVDGVVGLGGGSSLDTAKLVALLARSPQELGSLYGVDRAAGPRLPLILVPTTAGTGSEVTPVSVVTNAAGEKGAVYARQLLPDVAVLDAELTVGLPPGVTAATGVDAMSHAIEAFTSRVRKNPVADALAVEALRLLTGAIRTAVRDGADLKARGDMLLGAMLAGMAFSHSAVGAVHALAYPIGGRFHVPHGVSIATMLPHVLRFNAETAPEPYAALARALEPRRAFADDRAAASSFVDAVAETIAAVGLPTTLGALRIGTEAVGPMTEEARGIERLLTHNPRPIGAADIRRLYEAAL